MNKQQRLKQWIAALTLVGFLTPVALHAQDDAKSSALATEAITAKEKGDLVTAKAKLEEILKLNPADSGAQDLLKEVDKALLAGSPVEVAKPLSPLDKAAEENLNLFREVDRAMLDAQGLAAKGNPEGAVALLDQAAAALPDNPPGQAQKDRVTLLRQQILAVRDSRDVGGPKTLAARTIAEEVRTNRDRVTDGRRLISEASAAISDGRFDDASAALDKAASVLPANSTADTARVELKRMRSKLFEARYSAAIDSRDIGAAEQTVTDYENLNGRDDPRARSLRAEFTEKLADPHFKSIKEISPDFAANEKKANELLAKGRAQYLYGDYLGALETYKYVLQYQPYNTEAKTFSIRIREVLHEKSGAFNPEVTKAKLLEEIDMKWDMAGSFIKDSSVGPKGFVEDPVIARMKEIRIPQVVLRDIPLDRAIETLGELSLSYDKDQKGVNFIVIDHDKKNPNVSLTIRDMTLDRVLEQVLRTVNYSYTVNNGIVEVRPDTGNQELEYDEFPISRQGLTQMTGTGAVKADATTGPFGGGGATAAGDGNADTDNLKRVFRNAGIEFDDAKGQTIGYNGTVIMANQTRRNLDRIRNIVRRYTNVKQVAIETKFIEVTQSDLNQISTNWTMTKTQADGYVKLNGATGNRTLDSAFKANSSAANGNIAQTNINGTADPTTGNLTNVTTTVTNTPIPGSVPVIPGSTNYGGSNAIGAFGTPSPSPFLGTFTTSFGIGSYDVNLFVQALEQTTGSDLMAAPSLTVASGATATIKIAQILRYPESYSAVQSQVSSSSSGGITNGAGSSSASVAITAGTPQDFAEKEIGVVMEVTPTVAESGDLIDLDLKPKIIEFDGFVEYGGSSVAIAGDTTVTVPSGFFQPVFNIRDVATKVTVYDGATVVIGGLTREEVQTLHDKVPVLGDLPLIGKLFQSNGKTTQKKNLMIFVTANMISPAGSQLKGTVGGVRNGTTFQNPTLASPSGPLYRAPVESKTDK